MTSIDATNGRTYLWDGAFASRRESDIYQQVVRLLSSEDWPELINLCSRNEECLQFVVEKEDTLDGRWSTLLHQCIYRRAYPAVIRDLLSLGSFASIPDGWGRKPWQIAQLTEQPDQTHLLRRRVPVFALPERRCERVLRGLLKSFLLEAARNCPLHGRVVRLPKLIVLKERPGASLWFPVVGMMGGFRIELEEKEEGSPELIIDMSTRMDGMVTRWQITPEDATLVGSQSQMFGEVF